MNRDVVITRVPCPHTDAHKSAANLYLRQRPDGTLFCPVHGEIPIAATSWLALREGRRT